MSTRDWLQVYQADLHPGSLPRLSARVIERVAERQDRAERRIAEAIEVERLMGRRKFRRSVKASGE